MEPTGSTFFWSFALFLLLAPLYKAGNRAVPLLLLELAAIALLLALVLGHRRTALPRSLKAALAVLLGYPLLQLLPLPDDLWRALPGHAAYAAIAERFGAPAFEHAWRAISVVPQATEYGWLALLPPVACLAGAQALSSAQVVRLLVAMAVFSALEGLLGLLQAAAGRESIFFLGNTDSYGTPTGTFVNSDHFAAMLAMMLPVIVGLLVFDIRRRRREGRYSVSDANVLSQRVLLFASAALVLLCLLLTFSRGGIATALVGLALSSVLLMPARASRRNTILLIAGLIGVGIALLVLIGSEPVLERFAPGVLRLASAQRFLIYAATLRAAFDFLPFGSGLSTFASVFPRFQGEVFGGYIDYAHSDWLQLFMELGLAAPLIVVLLLAAYVLRMRDLLRRKDGRSFTLLQIAAGIGLVPPALHAMFDFPLHIPANAMWFATLAGVMLHPGPPPRTRAMVPDRGRVSEARDVGGDDTAPATTTGT